MENEIALGLIFCSFVLFVIIYFNEKRLSKLEKENR